MADHRASMSDILEACLQAIETRGWTVDDCLVHFASYRHDLEPLLKTVEQLRPAQLLSPSPDFQEQALSRLRTRLKQTARPESNPSAKQSVPPRSKVPVRPFYTQRGFALGLSALIILMGLALTATGTIYAAGSALPGDLLYPVGRTIEQAQLGFASPGQALELRMDLADKRLTEVEHLRQKGDYRHVQEALDGYNQLISGLTIVGSGSGAGDPASLDRLNTRLLFQQDRLEALLSAAPPAAQAGLTAAIEASKRGQERVEQAVKDLGDNDPEKTLVPTVPAQATNTITPLLASTQTNTSIPGTTDTPGPGSIEPTSTTMPVPTNTGLPTEVPVAVATDTPVSSCDNVAMAWRDTTGNSVRITITNTNSSPIALTEVRITWPASNKDLKHIKFTGTLWSGKAAPPSFSTGVSGPSVVLDPARQPSTDLIFQFGSKASPDGYTITVSVDIGCLLTVNN